jgi:F-type H+-transporting ATPase subunit b
MWFRSWILFVALTVWSLTAATAIAAPEEPPTAGEHSHTADSAAQPSIFEYALDLTIWTIVVFLVLLWVLGRYAWKPMLEGLQRREENIRRAIDEAQAARLEAERVRAQFQAEMNQAAAKVRDMLDEGRQQSLQLKDEMLSQAKSEIQKERERLRREIETARDQALQDIWNQAAKLATLISAKAIKRHLSEEDHRRLIDESVADLGRAGADRQSRMIG